MHPQRRPITPATLEHEIARYVRDRPENRLPAFEGAPIFDEPLVGYANGDDPIFERFKTVVGNDHLTPREVLKRHWRQLGERYGARPASVISFVLPIARETRVSNRRETRLPSLRWNQTRWLGQQFVSTLSRHLIEFLEQQGYAAVAPEVEEYFRITESDSGLVSNWSQRHIAFPAGLGTFSLSDGLITPRGVAMRCGSVVSDLPLPTSRRLYESHLFNCLFYRDGSCGKCIDRCPVGAISEKGHDRKRCQECLFVDQRVLIERSGASGYTGAYAGCGLCQTKVPCEDRIPRSTRSPEAAAQPGT